MINLFHNHAPHKQQGGATLILSIMLMVTATLIIIFAANHSVILEKISANSARNAQAFHAAEAGLEYAINYLQKNSTLILANISGGYLLPYSNSSTTNVVLSDNSKYSFVYTNPIANNYNLIQITSTGTSSDNSATRVISQQVQFGSLVSTPPTTTLTTKGSLTMGGSAVLTNTANNQTVQSASTVTLSGSAQTVTSGGTSSVPGNIKSDVSQNNSALQSLTQSDFFASFFGVSANTIKGNVAHYYSNSSSTNYSSTLNGMTGTSIWIDQSSGSATLNGTTTIGSPTAPVLLVVNGDIDLKGTLTIYGFIYVIGNTTTEVLGNVTINGALVTTGNLTMTGSTQVTYNPTVLSNLQNQSSMSYFAKVSGSWKDF